MILIRHGETEFARVLAASRCDRGIYEPVLTEERRHQAAARLDRVEMPTGAVLRIYSGRPDQLAESLPVPALY
ncbi:MAG: hypothetical protein WB678_19445 [Stellaceae bacterium]